MSTSNFAYGSAPPPDESLLSRGYGNNAESLHDSTTNHHIKNAEHLAAAGLGRSPSVATASAAPATPSRSGTLKKKGSVRRTTSLRRSSSRKSLRAGSIKGLGDADFDSRDFNSAFYTPVPTTGTPTDALADRFQAWRQLLKSLITYFREIQSSYESRAKAIHKVQNTLANIAHPPVFNSANGLAQASRILEDYHKRSLAEASKSRDIEEDVIGALTGLRADLGQKIKEIKSLSGDFKNSVDKERDTTRREVEKLQEALAAAEVDDPSASGKHDPFVVRLGVDRAVERQLDEENYLHRAYLNLESSGRELESIVVGEIQKAYNALAGILRREGDDAYHAVETLRTGPISMPKDLEWMNFVVEDEHFVDPSVPLRRIEDIEYPGKHHPAAAEVRAGMLERKSKYLKSYTPGWYVLSPTHLHEFKSADKIYSQPPVMSLYLPDQRLGSKSELGSSSHKFMLKGKQTGGGVHKGHNWVFRAESHETMLAWYEAIRALTEKTGEERNAFVRQHARSVSGEHDRGTVSSDGFEEDEADATPFTADAASLAENSPAQTRPQRPQPGGRFPSDLRTPTISNVAGAVSEPSVDSVPRSDIAVAGVPVSGIAQRDHSADPYRLDGIASHTRSTSNFNGSQIPYDSPSAGDQPGSTAPLNTQPQQFYTQPDVAQHDIVSSASPTPAVPAQPETAPVQPLTTGWTHPALVGAAGAATGAAVGAEAAHLYDSSDRSQAVDQQPEGTAVAADLPSTAAHTTEPTTLDQAQPDLPSVAAHTSATAPAASEAVAPVSAVDPSATTTAAPTAQLPTQSKFIEDLGGLESEGARTTGRAIPVIRHDTNMSISGLHVPGQFPKGTGP